MEACSVTERIDLPYDELGKRGSKDPVVLVLKRVIHDLSHPDAKVELQLPYILEYAPELFKLFDTLVTHLYGGLPPRRVMKRFAMLVKHGGVISRMQSPTSPRDDDLEARLSTICSNGHLDFSTIQYSSEGVLAQYLADNPAVVEQYEKYAQTRSPRKKRPRNMKNVVRGLTLAEILEWPVVPSQREIEIIMGYSPGSGHYKLKKEGLHRKWRAGRDRSIAEAKAAHAEAERRAKERRSRHIEVDEHVLDAFASRGSCADDVADESSPLPSEPMRHHHKQIRYAAGSLASFRHGWRVGRYGSSWHPEREVLGRIKKWVRTVAEGGVWPWESSSDQLPSSSLTEEDRSRNHFLSSFLEQIYPSLLSDVALQYRDNVLTVLLCAYEGDSKEETAHLLDCSPQTIERVVRNLSYNGKSVKSFSSLCTLAHQYKIANG